MKGSSSSSEAAADEPDVLLDVECEGGLLHLVLANAGRAAARDVTVTFDPPLVGVDGGRIVSDAAIFRGLPLLRPGREIRVLLDAAAAYFRRGACTRFEARVSWRLRDGAARSAVFAHDLAVHRDRIEPLGGR